MSSFFSTLRAPLLGAAALALAACGGGAQSATPSSLVANPSNFDGQSVSVSGTVKGPHERKTRRGKATLYQLCDAQCINVFQFGDAPNVTEGATVSVTGMFRASFGRVRQISNVLLVGGRPGGHWNGGSPGASGAPGTAGSTGAAGSTDAAPAASPT